MTAFRATLTVSGRVRVPTEISFPSDVDRFVFRIQTIGVELHTWLIRRDRRVFFSVPQQVREVLGAPIDLDFVAVGPSPFEFGNREQIAVPIDESFTFRARMQQDGAVHVPMNYYRGLQVAGWSMIVRVLLEGGPAGPLRFEREISVRQGDYPDACFHVPQRVLGAVPPRTDLLVTISRVAAEAGAVLLSPDGIVDWLGVQIEHGFVTSVDKDHVNINSPRSIHRIRRRVKLIDIAWLLGMYLADGSETGRNEFTISQKSPAQLSRVRDYLVDGFGIDPAQISMGVLYGLTPRDEAVAMYEPCRIPIVWDRQGDNTTHSGVLRLSGSLAFSDAVVALIDHLRCGAVFDQPLEVKRAFLLGYQSGDGSFNLGNSSSFRYATADLDEARFIARLHDDVLGRTYTEPTEIEFRRTADLIEVVTLLRAGAFPASINRAKMFAFVADVTAKLARGGRFSWYAQERYFKDRQYRPELVEALTWFESELVHEADYVAFTYPTHDSLVTREKCKAYEYDPAWSRPSPLRYKVKQREATGQIDGQNAVEKVEQIRSVLAGSRRLQIYEAHSGRGYCTEAYRAFGDVHEHQHKDGDAEVLLEREVAEGHLYDVVDLDPYGFPLNMLFAAVRLVCSGGHLFVTCPNPRKVYSKGAAHIIRGFGLPQGFTVDEFSARLVAVAGGLRIELREVSRLTFETVWRLVYRVMM